MGREQALNQGYGSALEALAAAAGQSRGDITQSRDLATQQAQEAYGRAGQFYQPFTEGGGQAFQQQLALSGARGQEAFDQANMESPYVRYLQEQGERAVTRNAAALGGLRGGNVMLELQRQGQGLAGQGLQQQFNNLNTLSGFGMQGAAGQSGVAQGEGNLVSGITTQAGRDLANISQQAAQQRAQAMMAQANMQAQGRTDAGNLLAGQGMQTQQQLANLALQQGQNAQNIFGQTSGNLANLLSGYGQGQAGVNMQGSGQYAGLPGIPGTQQSTGILGSLGQAASGASALLALSDYRLKDNIQYTGTDNGVNLYSWDWKPEFAELTDGMPTTGVIAQELALTHPEAVFQHSSGFLGVDYSKVN